MKKILLIVGIVLGAGCALAGTPAFNALMASGVSASVACTDFSSGCVESFESSSYTTGWVETDSAGVITSGDSTHSLCGSKSLKLVSSSATIGDSRTVVDFGADGDLYAAIHFWGGSTFNAYSESSTVLFTANSDATNVVAGFKLLNNTGPAYVRITAMSEDPSESFSITETSAWYRAEMHIVGGGGASYLRLYYFNGSSWVSVLSSASNQDIQLPVSGNYTPRYMVVQDSTNNGTSTIFIDAAKVSLSSGTWIGDVTCP